MAKGIQAIMRGAGPNVNLDEMERELASLALATKEPPAITYTKPRPLSEEAQKIISKGIMLAATSLVSEATAAAAKYRDEAQAQYDEVVRWGETLVRETEKAANEIAESHAAMIRSSEHFRAAMAKKPKPEEIEHEEGDN